ncbi:hypothetical protein OUY26_04005 [Levilactobacillus brevis]|uniref:hypothetical protein n=1 Tax=Levilactobacillus brevis TaxID=1580 RepID=UPI002277A173|nr:hypothetical protein [Levilactobacillus brevis]WAE45771.1 hypothetical protein OUY26_04005 [Levilactobacillus brevis]
MVDSSRTIMTDAGFALETRVRADETKMQFTRAAISTDDHFSDTDDALAKLTELSNIQQDGKVTAVQVINTTTVYVQVDVNQAESKADYQMRSAALYAKDDDGTEVLYGVTVLQDPVFVHKDADGSYLGFGINTTVGRASNVVVVVDPANMVTQQVFESTMKNYYTKAEVDAKFVTDDDFASKLPRNIATTDAANTFAKSQTLAGGATDGKGNAYATTKDVATGLKNGFNTKVNVSDMRKPASDVVGLEDITTAYNQGAIADGTDVQSINKEGLYQLNGGSFINFLDSGKWWGTIQVINQGGALLQIARVAQGDIYTNSYAGSPAHWAGWNKLADDSKVAHLSGANNFDTIPTVNNNPLLLASSLPSDLARTGQDANFTGKLQQNGQNVALVNNTIARNPDTGVVSEPTDFTNLTVNGGKSVATRDDLKSIQLKMWHEIKLPDMFVGSPILMKYNPDDRTTMILGAKNATLKDGASWTGTLFTLPEGFHWIKTDSNMMHLYNMDSYNDNVSGRLYNTKLSRSGSSSDGSEFGIWFTSLSSSIISIDNPYTTVSSIQPD